MFKKKSTIPKYVSKSKGQILKNSGVSNPDDNEIYVTSTFEKTTFITTNALVARSSPVIIEPDLQKGYETSEIVTSKNYSCVLFLGSGKHSDSIMIIDLINGVPLHMLEYGGKIACVCSNDELDFFAVVLKSGAIFTINAATGNSVESNFGKALKKKVKGVLIDATTLALLVSEQQVFFINVDDGKRFQKDALEDKYWMTIDSKKGFLICTSIVGVYMWRRSGPDSFDRMEFATKTTCSSIIINEDDLYIGQIDGKVDRHELSSAEHLAALVPSVDVDSKKKIDATANMVIDMAFVDDYLVILYKHGLKVFHQDHEITNRNFKKKIEGGKVYIQNLSALFIRVVARIGTDIKLGEWKIRKSQLKTYINNAKKKRKYDWMSNSLTISPAIFDSMFSDEVFLDTLLATAVENRGGARLGKSLLKLFVKNKSLNILLSKLISAEFESVYSGRLLDDNYARNDAVNCSLHFTYFPTGGFKNGDMLFLESRFATMMLVDLFSSAGRMYIRKTLRPEIDAILKVEESLEVDLVALARIHGVAEEDEGIAKIAADNAEVLKGLATAVVDRLFTNLDSFPSVLQLVFNEIAASAEVKMEDETPNDKLCKSIGRIMSFYLSEFIINPPISQKVFSFSQRRNLSLVANILYGKLQALENAYPQFEGFDSDNKIMDLLQLYAITPPTGTSDTRLKLDPRDYISLGRYLKLHSATILEAIPKTAKVSKLLKKLYDDDSVADVLGEGNVQPDRKELEAADEKSACKFAEVLPVRFAPDYPTEIDEIKKQDILYGNLFETHPGDFSDLVSWLDAERKFHDFIIIVIYRGEWCPWCEKYMKEWNKYAAKIIGNNGLIVGLSSQSQTVATKNCAKWGVGYPLLGEVENTLALAYNVKTQKLPGYAYGMANPGTIAIDSEGRLIYHWVVYPSFANTGGQIERPLPTNVIDDVYEQIMVEDDLDETSYSSNESSQSLFSE